MTTLDKPDWTIYVPEVELRPQQIDALDRIWKAMYADGKRVVLLEAPTGVGKSIIEIALCRYEYAVYGGRSYVVTPQRQLQDQLGELGDDIRVMKGKNSYTCVMAGHPVTAATAPCNNLPEIRAGSPSTCSDSFCPYFYALAKAQEASIVVHNYASLLAQAYMSSKFGPRSLMCLDEGHTAASWMRNYLSIEISLAEIGELTNESPPSDPNKFWPWLRALLCVSISDEDSSSGIPRGLSERLGQTLSKAKSHRHIYGLRFSQLEVGMSVADLVEDLQETEVEWSSSSYEDQWTIVPIRVSKMAKLLTSLGSKILIVSATLLNRALTLAELGLQNEDSEFIRLDSAFERACRPVVCEYAGSMSYKRQKFSIDGVMGRCHTIIKRHDNQRGIIHTHSYRLANTLAEYLKERIDRPVVVVPSGQQREGVIRSFLAGGLGPTAILIGPALAEGIDGKYESARWQIVMKAPYPSKSDPVVSAISEGGRWGEAWYAWKTAQTLVQTLGRVCRAPDDYGITYLVDSDIARVISSDYVPQYIKDAVTH